MGGTVTLVCALCGRDVRTAGRSVGDEPFPRSLRCPTCPDEDPQGTLDLEASQP